MKVDALAGLGAQLARGQGALSIPDGGDFAAKLTLGQIIKGRVLRSYEGGRYAVDFGGEEHVVDSSVPLRTGEVLRGRVVGLGERVELQKLAPSAGDAAPPRPEPSDVGVRANGRGDEGVRALFERYAVRVDAAALELLQQVSSRLPPAEAQATALAGLVLAKQSVPISAEALRLVQSRLIMPAEGQAAAPPDRRQALSLVTAEAAAPTAAAEPQAALPAVLRSLLLDQPQAAWRNARDGALAAAGSEPAAGGQAGGASPGEGQSAAAEWILNGQTGGSVAHRLGRLPLVVDGRLLELDVALFEERRDDDERAPDGPARHRQIVLSLDTASLGRIDVSARLAGTHMQVRLAAPSSEATTRLSLHSARLEQDLRGLGWQLDGLAYETRSAGAVGEPGASVVEHIITPGSVSRLV